jgi:hypothetical protein
MHGYRQMRNLFSLAAFSGIAFKCVLAATVTAVDESEVEAALNTCPPRVEDSVLIDRVGSEGIGHWISSGRVVGETVFADEFKSGANEDLFPCRQPCERRQNGLPCRRAHGGFFPTASEIS